MKRHRVGKFQVLPSQSFLTALVAAGLMVAGGFVFGDPEPETGAGVWSETNESGVANNCPCGYYVYTYNSPLGPETRYVPGGFHDSVTGPWSFPYPKICGATVFPGYQSGIAVPLGEIDDPDTWFTLRLVLDTSAEADDEDFCEYRDVPVSTETFYKYKNILELPTVSDDNRYYQYDWSVPAEGAIPLYITEKNEVPPSPGNQPIPPPSGSFKSFDPIHREIEVTSIFHSSVSSSPVEGEVSFHMTDHWMFCDYTTPQRVDQEPGPFVRVPIVFYPEMVLIDPSVYEIDLALPTHTPIPVNEEYYPLGSAIYRRDIYHAYRHINELESFWVPASNSTFKTGVLNVDGQSLLNTEIRASCGQDVTTAAVGFMLQQGTAKQLGIQFGLSQTVTGAVSGSYSWATNHTLSFLRSVALHPHPRLGRIARAYALHKRYEVRLDVYHKDTLVSDYGGVSPPTHSPPDEMRLVDQHVVDLRVSTNVIEVGNGWDHRACSFQWFLPSDWELDRDFHSNP